MENYLISKWKVKRETEIQYAGRYYLSFDDRQGNRYPNAADRTKDANTSEKQ